MDLEMNLILWIIFGSAILSFLVWFLMKRQPRTLAQKITAKLTQSELINLTDIVLPDGIGGLFDIAQLVQIEQGIVVIEQLEAEGRVFGAEHIDLWTQILKGRSVKFENPLYGLSTTQQVIKNLIPGVPVHGLIVLGEAASFEKSVPEGVTSLVGLPQALAALPNQKLATSRCNEAWQRILRIARKDGKSLSGGI